MADCRSLPKEAGLDFDIQTRKQRFFTNSGQAQCEVSLKEDNPLPDMLAVVRSWLSSGNSRIVALQVAGPAANQLVGGTTQTVHLFFGSTDVAVAHLPISELVEALLVDLAGRAERINRYQDALGEMYRRYMMQPKEVLRVLKESKALERSVEHATYTPELPFYMSAWDEPVFDKLIIDSFNEASPALKVKMVKMDVLPGPLDYGGKYFGFWETLSRSVVPELKKAGTEAVEAYKEAMADAVKEK